MESSPFTFQVGSFTGIIVMDGSGPRNLADVLTDVPVDALEAVVRQHGFDPANVPFSRNIMLLKAGAETVLVDTGMGQESLPDKLAAAGFTPDAITLVIITHCHFDHIGGIFNPDDTYIYPNARYVMAQDEWTFWADEDRLAASESNPSTRVLRHLKADLHKMILVADGDAVLPGITAVLMPGHTPGQMGLLIESGGDRLLHIADAAHAVPQLSRPEWSPKFDSDKVQSARTRAAVFDRAVQEHLRLQAYHFPFPGQGSIHEADGMRTWQPAG